MNFINKLTINILFFLYTLLTIPIITLIAFASQLIIITSIIIIMPMILIYSMFNKDILNKCKYNL